jgi:hypothetical protein
VIELIEFGRGNAEVGMGAREAKGIEKLTENLGCMDFITVFSKGG